MGSGSEPSSTHEQYMFRRSAEQFLRMLEQFKGRHVLPQLYETDIPLSDADIHSVRESFRDIEKLIANTCSPEIQDRHFFNLYRMLTLSYYVSVSYSERGKGRKAAGSQKRVIDREAKRKIIEDVARSYLDRHPEKAGKLSAIATAIRKDVNLKIAAENASGKISAKEIGARAIYDHLQDTFGLQQPSNPASG